MVSIRTDTTRRNDVTFVRVVIQNDRNTAQIVKLRNRLDGPVWPPRFGNVTAPEWNGQTWEKEVGPGQQIGLGYACPEPVADKEPIEVVSASRGVGNDQEPPEEVLASLEEWAPERPELQVKR